VTNKEGAFMSSVLGSQRKKFWEDNGFLVFPGFFSEDDIRAVTTAFDRVWDHLPPYVVVDDLVTGRRCRISELDATQRRQHFKTNDLYLTEADLRAVILSERLGLILEDLLGDEASICNTLNFSKGSQQPDHIDTLYMTPVTERGLVATWMALEDTTPDSGPLRYYPESNQIPPYRFSDGSMHTHDNEMPRWADYMAEKVERRGLEEQRFLARRGDLFIWHALLLHGGSEIANPATTRQSLVTHYWTQRDCESRKLDLRPVPGGWWIHRPPLSVPDARQPVRPDKSDLGLVDFPAHMSHRPRRAADLRERMETLEGALD
jgi:ectoine hydroxylase-related dioxygenase (phytanoyl-CoA dioxygenase family)